MFEIQKSGNKTSSGEIGLDIEHMQVQKWDSKSVEINVLMDVSTPKADTKLCTMRFFAHNADFLRFWMVPPSI